VTILTLALTVATSLCLVGAVRAQQAASPSAPSATTTLSSGLYEGLLLAVSADGTVQGQYLESIGNDPNRRCSFTLVGRGFAGRAKLVTRSGAGALEGDLAAHDDGVVLRIPAGRDHSGCAMVLLPLIEKGLPLTKVASGAWTHLRSVQQDRLFLHAAPYASSRKGGYLVPGDVVAVVRQSSEWTLANFFDRQTGRRSSGWVHASGLGPLEMGRP
jgi:hypothetical protein